MPHSLFNLADDLRQTPEQAFLTDDSREILRFAVETLMASTVALSPGAASKRQRHLRRWR